MEENKNVSPEASGDNQENTQSTMQQAEGENKNQEEQVAEKLDNAKEFNNINNRIDNINNQIAELKALIKQSSNIDSENENKIEKLEY